MNLERFRRQLEAHKEAILREVLGMQDLMPLLMKGRNSRWLAEDLRRIRERLAALAKSLPVLAAIVAPGGLVLLPVLAAVLDRRKKRRMMSPPRPAGAAPPFLVFQHVEGEGLGLLESLLLEEGWAAEVIRMDQDPSFPSDLSGYSGLLVLGGPMSANDEDRLPWIREEIRLLRQALDLELPVLGICLGAQLLARAAGARVYPGQRREIGWHLLRLTPEGLQDPVLGPLGPERLVFQWHGETFDLPEGATLLAGSALYPHQAFRMGSKAYGLQFHLEVTAAMVAEWVSDYDEELEGAPPDNLLVESREHLPCLHEACRNVFRRFLELVSWPAGVEAAKP